jgi:hypothetical protein
MAGHKSGEPEFCQETNNEKTRADFMRAVKSHWPSSGSSPAAFEFSAAEVAAVLRFKRCEEALNIAHAIHALGKEARKLKLIGLAYRESGRAQFFAQQYVTRTTQGATALVSPAPSP